MGSIAEAYKELRVQEQRERLRELINKLESVDPVRLEIDTIRLRDIDYENLSDDEKSKLFERYPEVLIVRWEDDG